MDTEDPALTSPTLLSLVGRNPHDNEVWGVFLARYRPLIRLWCRKWGLLEQDAEEVSAIVVDKLFQAMPGFVYDPDLRFRGWLKTVVDNEVRSFRRQAARRPFERGSGDSEVRQLLEEQAAPDTEDLVASLAADLEAAQTAISQVRQRVEAHTWEAFHRTALGQEPAAEVARDLGISVGAVYEAKRRVGKLLRQEGQRQPSLEAGRRGGRS